MNRIEHNRIDQRFAALKAQGRTALIPYITAGDPAPAHTVDFMHACVEAGADVIELGVPFSDPMADGPVIQKACERALVHGTRLQHVLEMVAEFRQRDSETPVVLMGYLNPIERMGYEVFTRQAQASGVDGVLVVDMPPEEAGDNAALFAEHGLQSIFLLAPTTSEARARAICEHGEGYLYYVSLKGVTGAATLDADAVGEQLNKLRRITELPLCVGFGIRDGATAAAIGRVADGVIVGSALVGRIAEHADDPASVPAALKSILGEMREALDREAVG
ncbi:tryptophan synthase subunit alpha [Salinicola sp. LHM]|jgi:tryptophan synthase alpha chain|uniref:tryptophan synthase subunit alpha n=1 Tax=Salinicola TaxID=404432 RepID=UPI0008DC6506|nr:MULTISPECIES: tryptophan synthase subunit alpha [Salinicola]MEC8918609.1 tryptophan synthase subunit alpha [Pseudomonadota bacterium]MED5500518.1 tryptophan synthase subunit alpha [Pseudomonadota bacterium]OHZ00077.1 tryptophan synthase subunit alpha [Salinicola sp. MIT1003]WQH31770.1 tryptophan synthase subunit alpha [Salinicola sp. LHM]